MGNQLYRSKLIPRKKTVQLQNGIPGYNVQMSLESFDKMYNTYANEYERENGLGSSDPNSPDYTDYVDTSMMLTKELFNPISFAQKLVARKQNTDFDKWAQGTTISANPLTRLKTEVKLPSAPPTALPTNENLVSVADANLHIANETGSSVDISEKSSPLMSKMGGMASGIGKAADAVNGIVTSFSKDTTLGPNGDLRAGIDQGWNAMADAASSFGPYGQMASAAMKAVGALNSILGAIFGATDNMTKKDAIFDSPLGFLTGVGWINQAFGDTSDTITKDEEAFALVGSSYGGTGNIVDEALTKSGKKYGAFSGKEREEANNEILKAKLQLSLMANIASTALDRLSLRESMSAINGNRRGFAMLGGYNQSAVRVGKHGLKALKSVKSITSTIKYLLTNKAKNAFDVYLQSLPENLRDSTNYRVKDYWEFNNRPKDFKEAISKGIFVQKSDGWHANSVAENPTTGEIEFMKPSTHPTHHMEVDWYYSDDPEAIKFREEYELQKTDPYWKYVKRKSPIIEKHLEGGILEISLSDIPKEYLDDYLIQEIDLNSILEEYIEIPIHKDGGSIELVSEYIPNNPEEIIKFVNKHKKTNFVQRLKDSFRESIPDWKNENEVFTHKLNWCEDRGKIKVFPMILELDGELHDFSNPKYNHDKWDALESAEKNNDVLIFKNSNDADWFTKHYKEFYPTFDRFKEGGKVNVIPEGALHARLHHMENADNLTKKGIPVVSEKDGGELEQLAEIEREEVIFRLEVTKELEELKKKYENDLYSLREKDQFAVEAGKLLTYELLQNTVDNTGLLNKT